MGRRKDHSPSELRDLILAAAMRLIVEQGQTALTARRLARDIGYTPGTIYNFFQDMDALVTQVNLTTLTKLDQFCRDRIARAETGFGRLQALAYGYVDFAHENRHSWQALFSGTRAKDAPGRGAQSETDVPEFYRDKLLALFQLIERALAQWPGLAKDESAKAARLLWACLHGITILTLDGRLALVGAQSPHEMIDMLLERYVRGYSVA